MGSCAPGGQRAPTPGGAPPAGSYPVVNGIPCERSEQVRFHVHAHLAIYEQGQPEVVPYGIGIGQPWRIQQSGEGPFVSGGSCFYWLHTHTQDGVIHIEAPERRIFTLGEFFAIWGQPLSANQVVRAQGTVIAYVDGERASVEPKEIPLGAHEVVQLDVGADTPPQPFTFPPGL